MSRGAKLGIFGIILLGAIGGTVYLSIQKKKNKATEVRFEQVGERDLVAAVTASGKIEAKSSVDISADITGRISDIAVKEGDLVKKGQFLLLIDPSEYRSAVARAEGVVASSQAATVQLKATKDQAQRSLWRAKELAASGPGLIAPEAVEQARTAYEVASANLSSATAQLAQARAGLAEVRHNLGKTRLLSPINGRVVRLAVEEGEVAVPGTFSRETGLLMTIADLSVILAKVQVDETDVVRVQQGDSVEVAIDAFPDTTFAGRVSKVSNSAKLTPTQTATGSSDRAVDFDVEITLTNPPRDIRPDLSCTGRIITDTRTKTLSIPIIALTVREHETVPRADTAGGAPRRDTVKAFKKEKDREGVFIVKDGVATFRPVKVGIAGDEYFEVLSGVKKDETIVAGPYQAIRDLKDGAKVREAQKPDSSKKSPKA